MYSWGHVSKNSTACSHEWRARSTIALVFSTKAWHGPKRSSSGHGHKCQGRVQSGTNTGYVNCEQHLRLRPHLDQPTEPSSSVWALAGKCHMAAAERVSWDPVFCLQPSSGHICSMKSLPPRSRGLPCLTRVTVLPLRHKSSIWFHLTGAINYWRGGIIISSQLH